VTEIPHQRPVPEFDAPAQQALMDAFLEGIVVIDTEGIIERFNLAAEVMFGYSRDEMIGQDVGVLMPSPDQEEHDNYIQRYLSTGVARIIGKGREVQARRKDGSNIPVHLAIGEVGWGGSIRFVAMMRDLTDHKRAEDRTLRLHTDMINASRLATMGEMAAAMAHEINQPLAAIANYASAGKRMLKGGEGDIEIVISALDGISTQAHRAGEIIRRLRSFVRPEMVQRETASLSTIVHGIIPLAELDARANNIALEIDVREDLPDIEADQVQIQQVILNLLRNGIDAMVDVNPEDRQLTLTASADADDNIRIDVIDRGNGISEEVGAKLFNPFYTTKQSGMGMGLAICQTIVKSHGGTLSCANNLDSGATFSVTLPTGVT
jgi:two-component system sensor kinase FixL